MRTVHIAEIAVDEGGRLLIRPSEPDAGYAGVYRAAAEIRWDPERASFACPAPRAWSYATWFRHARDAVRSELGYQLEIDDHTAWTNVPMLVRAEIAAGGKAGH